MAHVSPAPWSNAPPHWMTAKPTRELIGALTIEGCDVRFVGGCVRDALLGRESADIDIGTPDEPERVLALLEGAGIETRTVPRGIEHGTVTALAGGERYEITTLRRDERTDGRHAEVAFTDDWQEDAARRDFTINAMSATPDPANILYDYFGGHTDLQDGRVRFVGDPATRIAEDHLRVLRFFRFHAWYGKGEPNAAALAACKDAAHTIPSLSAERVQAEMLTLLAAGDPMPALRTMQDAGVLAVLLPEAQGTNRLINLIAIERTLNDTDPIRRLAALITPAQHEERDAAVHREAYTSRTDAVAKQIAARWRLVADDGARLAALCKLPAMSDFTADEHSRQVLLYRLGPDYFRDVTLMTWALQDDIKNESAWEEILDEAAKWEARPFLLNGEDVLARGIPEGPKVGRLLTAVEDWWIEHRFAPDRSALLEKLDALVAERRRA